MFFFLLGSSLALAGDCPTLGAEPVRLPTLAASCLGDASHVYAVRRDGDSLLVKRVNLSLTSAMRTKATQKGTELTPDMLTAGRVYAMWDPPVANVAYIKLLEVPTAYDDVK